MSNKAGDLYWEEQTVTGEHCDFKMGTWQAVVKNDHRIGELCACWVAPLDFLLPVGYNSSIDLASGLQDLPHADSLWQFAGDGMVQTGLSLNQSIPGVRECRNSNCDPGPLTVHAES